MQFKVFDDFNHKVSFIMLVSLDNSKSVELLFNRNLATIEM
jgi:hypothetical protein